MHLIGILGLNVDVALISDVGVKGDYILISSIEIKGDTLSINICWGSLVESWTPGILSL